MTIINRLTFLSVLCVSVCFTLCNGQVKATLPKENTTFSTGSKRINPQAGGNVHPILQDKNGNLWFGTTGDGVYRYDGNSFTNFTTKNGLNSNAVSSILEDKKGTIWFGTDSGISRYDGRTFTSVPLSLSGNDFVTSMLEDKSGKLWVGTHNHGVYRYDGKAFERFLDDPNVINSKSLTLQVMQCMLEDKHGNIWFTTKTEGICRFDGKSLISYTPDGELWFRGLLEDKNGNIWAGTRYQGVYRYEGNTFKKVLQNGSFDTYTILSIIQDKSGNIWFGTEAGDQSKRETEGGVWVYDGISFKNISRKGDLIHNAVWSVLEDKSGNIWVGTRSTGLYRYDGRTFTRFSE